MSEATLSRLRLVAECFRDAAYIYLHSTLERTPALSKWSSLISHPKGQAIANLLSRLKTQTISNNCEFSALTFPLFIAGSETNSGDEEDRAFILRTLTTLEVNFGIGNVKRAKEVLRVLWRENENENWGLGGRKHWVDVLERLGWDLNLA